MKRTNKRLGMDFESRVLKAFERNGYVPIRKNQWKRNFDFCLDNAKKREYDLVFYNPSSSSVLIVECKAHFAPCALTGLEEVMEFSKKLRNYNGRHAKAVMVTDTGYTSPAKRHADELGIAMVDGASLRLFERNGSVFRQAKSKVYATAFGRLERALERVLSSYL